MMSIFVMFFNLVMFVFVASIIAKNVMNIKNISERFKTMYDEEGKERVYTYMRKSHMQNEKEQENMTFDSTTKLDNNPIKEKKRKRRNI